LDNVGSSPSLVSFLNKVILLGCGVLPFYDSRLLTVGRFLCIVPAMKQQTYRVGVDIGGTFTDIFLLSTEGEIIIGKVLTTPRDPAEAVVHGLQVLLAEQGITPASVTHLVHGTTLITNAIIERKGAKTGLITTRGFRDALEIGRERRYDIY